MSKPQPDICLERHGFANPLSISIACKCEGCAGELHCDSINAMGALGFLVCTVCYCVYTTPANKEIRR